MPRQKVVKLHLPAQHAGGWCRDHAIPPKIAFQNVHGDFLPFKSWAVRFRPPDPDKARHTSCLWLRVKSRDFYMRESGGVAVAAKSVRAVRLRPSATIVAGSPATREKALKKRKPVPQQGSPEPTPGSKNQRGGKWRPAPGGVQIGSTKWRDYGRHNQETICRMAGRCS